MPAFNADFSRKIVANIRTLFHRRNKVGDVYLSDEEYLATFVPAAARDLFREVGPLIAKPVSRSRFNMSMLGSAQAVLHLHGTTSPPVPRRLEIQPDAPGDVLARINSWIENGGDVSRDFGRVVKVFEVLNREHSKVSMRYYWPTILALCSESPDTKDMARELQHLRTPTTLRSLPPGLATACKQAANTIATARLLPTDTTAPVYTDGATLLVVHGHTYAEDFATFSGET
jgi:hypothetical protein